MKQNPSSQSRSKLRASLIAFGVGSIVVINGLLAMDLVRQHGAFLGGAEQGQQTLATGLEQYTLRTLETVDASLIGLSDRILDAHGPISLDHPDITALLETTFTGPNVANLLVFNASGRFVNDAEGVADPEISVNDRAYFRIHRMLPETGLFVDQPLTARTEDEARFVAASRGLHDEDGQFLGVVVAGLYPDYYADMYSRLVDPEGTVALLDTRGDVVTFHGEDPAWLLDQELPESGTDAVELEHPDDGESYLTVTQELSGYPLMQVVATPVSAVMSGWWQNVMRSGLLATGITLLLGFGTLLLVRLNDRGVRAEKRLRESEERFRGLIESTSDFVWEMDENGYCVYASPQVKDIIGYEPEEVMGMRPYDPMTADEQDRLTAVYHEVIQARQPFHMLENRNLHRDGREVVLETSGVPIFDESGEFRGYRGIDRDITERKRLEEALHALALLTGHETETEFFQLIARYLSRALGMRWAFVIEIPDGRHPRIRAHHDELEPRGHTPPTPDPCLARLAEQGRTVIREDAIQMMPDCAMLTTLNAESLMSCPVRRTSGERWGILLAVDTHALSPARSSRLEPVLDIFTSRVSLELDRNDAEAALSWEATHDTLTGLWNRRAFEAELYRVLSHEPGPERAHSLLYIDLDQFKVVNDTCGHAAGDQLLRKLSQRMREQLRANDQIARLGGDEFGLVLENCPTERSLEIAESLLKTIQEFQFQWEGRAFTINASIGIARSHEGGTRSQDLLAQADLACYAAKDLGRGRIQVYQADDQYIQTRHGEMGWVPRLDRAIEEGRLEIHGQWVVPLARDDGRRPSLEVLVRLREEDGSLIAPAEFLSAAERYNMMPRIDRFVIDAVMAHAASHSQPAPRRWSINLSGTSLADGKIADFIEDRFAQYGLDPRRFCFELTETAAITNFQHARELFTRLRALGTRTALDDFGSGLSSFGYLHKLRVDALKIDGSFVRQVDQDPVACSIVRAMNEMGHAMGLDTVAEFVENPEIHRIVTEIGVDLAQGYGIHRPEPIVGMGEPPDIHGHGLSRPAPWPASTD